MKETILKNYSNINKILFIVTIVFAIIPLLFDINKYYEYNLYQIMILAFLFTEIIDIIVSSDSINLRILTLNQYSKIITPIFIFYNIGLVYTLNFTDLFSYEYYEYSSYISFGYAFIPTLIRIKFDKYYVYRLLKK